MQFHLTGLDRYLHIHFRGFFPPLRAEYSLYRYTITYFTVRTLINIWVALCVSAVRPTIVINMYLYKNVSISKVPELKYQVSEYI